MILYAKSFSRTDPERKPRDLIGFYSPHLDANKVIHKIPLRYLVSLLRGVSFVLSHIHCICNDKTVFSHHTTCISNFVFGTQNILLNPYPLI